MITRIFSLALFIAIALSLGLAQKTVHVKTYTRKDGTVVQAHNRAAPGTANRSSSSSSSRARNSNVSTSPSPIYWPTVTAPTATRSRTVGSERDENGRIKRSESAKHEFMLLRPGPSTGRTSGSCPGYVIDHIRPLACGGADDPSNMQWQTKEAAKAKDGWERKGCR
jgi:hypothetical protein